MLQGQCEVEQEELDPFLATARGLQVEGLATERGRDAEVAKDTGQVIDAEKLKETTADITAEDLTENIEEEIQDVNLEELQLLVNETFQTKTSVSESELKIKEEKDRVDVVESTGEKPLKRKSVYKSLRAPVIVKADQRTEKVNLHSFRTRFSTLKKKVSGLQSKHGLERDFILIFKNNLQNPNVPNPSLNAGKYMVCCEGPIKQTFNQSGLKFDNRSMYLMANNFDYTEELTETSEDPQEEDTDPTEPASKLITTSFRTRYLTIKKLVSVVQAEHGVAADYLLLVRNNLQGRRGRGSSPTAGRYMAACQGPARGAFLAQGLYFDTSNMHIVDTDK